MTVHNISGVLVTENPPELNRYFLFLFVLNVLFPSQIQWNYFDLFLIQINLFKEFYN